MALLETALKSKAAGVLSFSLVNRLPKKYNKTKKIFRGRRWAKNARKNSLSRKTDIKVGRVFKRLINASSIVVVNVGGTRSGKSYAVAQLLIMKALNSPVYAQDNACA